MSNHENRPIPESIRIFGGKPIEFAELLKKYANSGKGSWKIKDVAIVDSKDRWVVSELLKENGKFDNLYAFDIGLRKGEYELRSNGRFYLVKIYDPEKRRSSRRKNL